MKRYIHTATLLVCLLPTGHLVNAANADKHHHNPVNTIGVPGKAAQVTRTVEIRMNDTMRFDPPRIDVRQGETIRIVVTNSGQLKHEFMLGTEKDLLAHAALMKKFPEMVHSEPNMVSLAPGKKGEVVWRFTQTGKVDFACLQPGHYEAGMKGSVWVATPDKTAPR